MVMITCLIISCSKNEDNTVVVRKPYAWVAGERDSTGYGMILFSTDTGETWVRQGLGSAALQNIDVSDIWAVDENNVWAVCSGTVILKTSDGGQTWTRVPAPANNPATLLTAISIVNKNNIWISGTGGTVYNTNDNGNTWQVFNKSFFHDGLMQGIWAITPQKIFVVGGFGIKRAYRGFIGYTLDGGSTWDSVVPANDYNRNEWIGVAASGNTIVVYGGQSHYLFSTDGGSNWKNDSLKAGGGALGADINHLIMLTHQIWWAALDMGHIYLTTDGGAEWTLQETGQGGSYMLGIDAWDSRLALAVGEAVNWPDRGPIVRSSTGGATWELIKAYRSNLQKVSFIKP
jgi:photosystem II stability/assembly factor-like uncharacterized protein